MSRLTRAAGLAVLVLSGALPAPSFGDVKVDMKNGSSIVADECREEGSNLVCYKMGGSFEIDKKDVQKTENIPAGRSGYSETGETDTAGSEKAQQTHQDGTKTDGAVKGEGTVSKADGKDALKTVDPRAEELLSLQAERERLVKEKKQLEDDMKNAPGHMADYQFNELNRRNAAMDAQIKQFNEKARQLTEKKGPASKE